MLKVFTFIGLIFLLTGCENITQGTSESPDQIALSSFEVLRVKKTNVFYSLRNLGEPVYYETIDIELKHSGVAIISREEFQDNAGVKLPDRICNIPSASLLWLLSQSVSSAKEPMVIIPEWTLRLELIGEKKILSQDNDFYFNDDSQLEHISNIVDYIKSSCLQD